jgi:hypothetical protein
MGDKDRDGRLENGHFPRISPYQQRVKRVSDEYLMKDSSVTSTEEIVESQTSSDMQSRCRCRQNKEVKREV